MFPGILSVPIELPPNCVYTWELYVIPGARSAGIGTQLAHARHTFELKRGNTRTRRVVRLDNPSAMRTVEKTLLYDSRVVGEIRYTKVLSRFFVTRLAMENESQTVRRLREKAAGR
jgi:ribosomal protein S18 acetylase RimI-like enzyme